MTYLRTIPGLTTPVAGPWTAALFLVVGSAFGIGLWTTLDLDPGGAVGTIERRPLIFAGLAYGGFSALVWCSSRFQHSWWRWLLVAVVASLLMGGLSRVSGRPMLRYVSLFAGLAIVQGLLFRWTAMPAWRDRSRPPANSLDSTRKFVRFQLSDLLVLMTAFAVLAASARAYQLSSARDEFIRRLGVSMSEDPVLTYWFGVALAWGWLPVLSWGLARAVMATSLWHALGWLSTVAVWAVAGIWCLVAAQTTSPPDPLIDASRIWGDYFFFVCFYVISISVILFAGRLDGLGGAGLGGAHVDS